MGLLENVVQYKRNEQLQQQAQQEQMMKMGTALLEQRNQNLLAEKELTKTAESQRRWEATHALSKRKVEIAEEKAKDKDPFKGVTKEKTKKAQNALMSKFLVEQRDTLIEGSKKWKENVPFFQSKKEYLDNILSGKLKPSGKAIFGKLGITKQVFFDWAKKRDPELTRYAFPGKVSLEQGR